MTIYGYARVSTSEQNIDMQKQALASAGAVEIFSDTITGTSKDRPGLSLLLDKVQRGDVVLVWKLDRLGRSARNLLELAELLKSKGVSIRSLQDGIDTSGPLGGFLLTILGAVGELERETIRERVRAGMEAGKRRGEHQGRKPKLSRLARQDVVDSVANGVHVKDLARRYSVNVATVYRVLSDSVQGVERGERLTRKQMAEPVAEGEGFAVY